MERYADPVAITYQYNKDKNNYKKFIPKSLKEIPEQTGEFSMVFEDVKTGDLIYAMRGLDFNLIKGNLIGKEQDFDRPPRWNDRTKSKEWNELNTLIDIMGSEAFEENILDNNNKNSQIRIFNAYKNNLLEEETKLKNLMEKNPNKKIILAGHSRGGLKARELAKKYDLEAHVYNPGEFSAVGKSIIQLLVPVATGTPTNINRALLKDSLAVDFGIDWFELIPKKAPIFNADITNPIPRFNNFLIRNMGTLAVANNDIVRTALATNNWAGAISNYLGTRYGGAGVSAVLDEYLYSPLKSDFNIAEIGKTLGYATKSIIDPKKRETEKINIYRTASDIVSSGYKNFTKVEPKEYVEEDIFRYVIGNHAHDHFISRELFDAIKNNEPIKQEPEPIQQIPIQQEPEPIQPLPQPIKQPLPEYITYQGQPMPRDLNPYDLCETYPFLVECEFLNKK
jgi:hypothetical protein